MILIIDGNQLACRCYFSLEGKRLSNSQGKRTETIYGVLCSLRKLIREYAHSDSVVFMTWDGGNERRRSFYPEYKAGRKKFENAFYEQLDELRKIIKCLGIKQYHIENVEADDIIGTLTYKCRKKGKKVLIVSSDHDFEQLISRHVEVLHPLGKNLIKDVQFVIDTYGVPPEKLVEVMAITGDPTDNIVGIESIGDKTAAKLIIANGSLENVLSKPEELKFLNRKGEVVDAKNDLKEKIKANINNIKTAYRLVEICNDIEGVEPDFLVQQKDPEKLEQIFKELEFRQFTNENEFWKRH